MAFPRTDHTIKEECKVIVRTYSSPLSGFEKHTAQAPILRTTSPASGDFHSVFQSEILDVVMATESCHIGTETL